jgi:1-acyl-sn-glycerol-3-phosphate acyltransferase
MKLLQTSRRQPGRSAISVIFWWVFVSNFVLLLLKILYRIQRHGRKNIPESGPAIFIANHQSFLDPPIVGVLTMDRPFSSLARASLFRNWFVRWLITQLGAVPLKQGRGDAGALKTALGELEQGRTVLLFPEGSRTPDGAIHEFQRGVLLLIKKANAPIIPIALEGAYDVWPATQTLPKLSGRLGIKAGKPINPDDLLSKGQDEALERLRREIETMRLELREEMRQRTNGRFPAKGVADQAYWEPGDDDDAAHDRESVSSQSQSRKATSSS